MFLLTGVLVKTMAKICHKFGAKSFDGLAKGCFLRFHNDSKNMLGKTRQGNCFFYFYNVVKICSYAMKISRNIDIDNFFFHSKECFPVFDKFLASCLSAFINRQNLPLKHDPLKCSNLDSELLISYLLPQQPILFEF